MVKTKELSLDLCSKIINLHIDNKFGRKRISKLLNLSISTVRNILTKFNQFRTITNFPQNERPSKSSSRTARNIVRMAWDDPKLIAQELNDSLKDIGVFVSERTVKRTLDKNDLYGHRPRRKPLLKNKHKEARLEFAKKYVHSPNSFSDDVLFTNETKIKLFTKNTQNYVWRRSHDALREKCIMPTVKYRGGSLLLWGCFSSADVGQLHRIDGIMKAPDF